MNEKLFKKNIKFSDQNIGEGNPVFLIAEIGINHNGDLNKAIDLIKAAKEAGADTAKLQTYVTEKRVKKDNPVYDILKKCELTYKDHKELFDFAKSINFKIFSTAFDDDSINLLAVVSNERWSTGSPELPELPLTRSQRTTGRETRKMATCVPRRSTMSL